MNDIPIHFGTPFASHGPQRPKSLFYRVSPNHRKNGPSLRSSSWNFVQWARQAQILEIRTGMANFLKFDMVVSAPDELLLWWKNLSYDHKRELNKHMGWLTSLMQMPAYPELIEVLAGYWDPEKMVFRFGMMEITPTIEEIQDVIDTVGMAGKRRVRKEESVLIPDKPTERKIREYLGLRQADWAHGSNIAFRDLYDRFGHSSFFVTFNQEFESYQKWDTTRPLAFAIALLGVMVFPHGPSLSINTRVIMVAHTAFHGHTAQNVTRYYSLAPTILADMYRALGRCRNGHRYFQGCNLLLQWWFINHLLKREGTQPLSIPDNQDPLLGLSDTMYWGNFEGKRTRERWAQVFSELGEDNVQWMFNRFISKEIVIRGHKLPFLALPGIRGIRPYAPLRVLRQFGRKQTVPPTMHMNIYVFDHGDDRVPNAGDILKEWKKPSRLAEKTIAEDRFNAGYVDGYKSWLKNDFQGLGFSVRNIYRGLEDKESQVRVELGRVKNEAREIQEAFLQKQEKDKHTIDSLTQELENLRNGLAEMDSWMNARGEKVRYETWEEKGRRYDGYWLMAQYELHKIMGQSKRSRTEEGPSGASS